ncbi:FAD-dependent oxidoreductase [Streptomyces sp. TRM 70351]|uniref:FAD-dependent oxidoreductase n=1 Tax=Streptomyces sp. TRM 70351 TaxID=3116552 RepID=UPI002E7B1F08|nr:FAD-dependent oxidoreductase [Streptomyces sp. TRM 70351]MEE1926873.1 FAD-dependent oxidoreductase [Streptomyces sp. TRM 70351]
MRVGIAGGGLAGLTLAWLLEGCHDVVLLEARPRLGGNAESVTVRSNGHTHGVDLGVRETAPGSFPVWRHVATEAGLTAGDLVTSPATRTLSRARAPEPAWVSPAGSGADGRPVTPRGPVRRALARFVTEAARWEAEEMGWDVTLGELVETWPGHIRSHADLLYALPASVHGCTLQETRGLSARAVGAQFAGPEPSEERAPEVTYLRGGTGTLVHALAGDLRAASVRVGTPLRAVTADGEGFALVDAVGGVHAVDAVVLALPADRAREALTPLAGAEESRTALAAVPHRSLTYALHRDPFGMPADRAAWSTSNTAVHDGWSETTTWYGPSSGADLFVSQLTHRAGRPRQELARSSYRTVLPTPGAVRARSRLAAAPGARRLFFAGHCTTPIDTQEAAMASAVAVAERLAPGAGRLRRLRHDVEGG